MPRTTSLAVALAALVFGRTEAQGLDDRPRMIVSVVDDTGEPSRGARVTVDSAASWGGTPQAEGRTDSTGRCEIPLSE